MKSKYVLLPRSHNDVIPNKNGETPNVNHEGGRTDSRRNTTAQPSPEPKEKPLIETHEPQGNPAPSPPHPHAPSGSNNGTTKTPEPS